VSAARAAATRETVAFCRQRETFWLLFGVALACTAPLLVVLAALARDPRALNSLPTRGEPVLAGPVIGLSEVAGNFLRLGEVCLLAVLALFMASRALESEIAGGSWTLLRLTATPVRSTLLGKAAGITVVLAAVHGFATSLLLLVTPFLRRTHAEVWVGVVGGFLVAVSMIPEGFAQASLLRGVRLRSLLLRLVTAARLAALLALLQLAAPGGDTGSRGMPFPRAQQWIDALSGEPWTAGVPLDPFPLWAVAVLWMGLSGLFIGRLVWRAWRS